MMEVAHGRVLGVAHTQHCLSLFCLHLSWKVPVCIVSNIK